MPKPDPDGRSTLFPLVHPFSLSPRPNDCTSLGAVQGVLAPLAGLNLESASAVNPALVRLQMLRGLAEAWALRWPAQPLATRTLGTLQHAVNDEVSATQPTVPGDAKWREAERRWQDREAAAGARDTVLLTTASSFSNTRPRHGILQFLSLVLMSLHPGLQ